VAVTDTPLDAWRSSLATLGSRLVDLESLTDVAVARSGVLTGATGAAWSEADAGLARAWEAYRVLDQLVTDALADPTQAVALFTRCTAPGPDGAPTDPSTALAGAQAALDHALSVLERLGAAWGTLAGRIGAVRTAAAKVGDQDTERTATALAELVTTDPFAVTEADVAGLEAKATASSGRHAAAQAAVARLDVDLARSRDELAALDADVQTGAAEIAHAATRIAGVRAVTPVPDLPELGTWLERIAATAETDRARAATDLLAWGHAAAARRAELDAALAPARSGMQRREDGRGLWTALRAKAAARKLDERPDVATALDAARTLLWSAPCDLDAADAALRQLSTVLNRPQEDR
jgi:hypothetical protein